MKKTIIFLIMALALQLSFGQITPHNRVKITGITELTSIGVSDKVVVLDPVTNELKYVAAQDLPGAASGLEAINEGNGDGYRIIGFNPANYGNIGFGSVDFGQNSSASTTFGATGLYGLNFGENNTHGVGKYYGFTGGDSNVVSNEYGFAYGSGNISSNYLSNTFGWQNNNHSAYSFSAGVFTENDDFYTAAFGLGTIVRSPGGFVVGVGNTDYVNTILNHADSRIFVVGNGTMNAGGPNTVGTRSDAMIVYWDGRITAPSLSNAEIDAAGTTSIITKDYSDNNFVHLTGDELILGTKTFNTGDGFNNIVSINDIPGTNQGIYSLNASTGRGIFSDNTSIGRGIYSNNTSTGDGIYSFNALGGRGIVSNGALASSGFVYVGQNNGVNTFTVDRVGNLYTASGITSKSMSIQSEDFVMDAFEEGNQVMNFVFDSTGGTGTFEVGDIDTISLGRTFSVDLITANTQTDGNAFVTGFVKTSQYQLSSLNTAPASASAVGTLGEIRITSGFIYVCIANNTWVRAALAAW